MFFILCIKTSSFKYSNITQDKLDVHAKILDESIFYNVSCREISLIDTESIIILTGIQNLKIINLPSSLNKINFLAFPHMTDLSFTVTLESENIYIDHDSLFYSDKQTYLIRYFGKKDKFNISFPCTICPYAFDIHDYYVNELIFDAEVANFIHSQPNIFNTIIIKSKIFIEGSNPIKTSRLYLYSDGKEVYFDTEHLYLFHPEINLDGLNPQLFLAKNVIFYSENITGDLSEWRKLENITFVNSGNLCLSDSLLPTSRTLNIHFLNTINIKTFEDTPLFSLIDYQINYTFPTNYSFIPSNFFSCANLGKEYKIKEDVIDIGTNAFEGCITIEKIILPPEVHSLKRCTFRNCRNLKEIDLSNIESIGHSCFSGCKSLKKINISNVNNLGSNAFSKCTDLKEVILSNKLRYIPENLFSHCYNLTVINIHDNVSELGKNCFDQTSIEVLRIPNSVERIGSLGEMKSLKKLYIEQNSRLSKIIYTLFGSIHCYGTKKNLPNLENIDLTSNGNFNIKNDCLYDKDYSTLIVSLTRKNSARVYIMNRTKTIQTLAFFNNPNIKSIISIDNMNLEISTGAFYNLTNLRTIVFRNETLLSNNSFIGCMSLSKLKTNDCQQEFIDKFKYSGIQTDILNSTDFCQILPEPSDNENIRFIIKETLKYRRR